ncbi:unnamed protein product [Acanthosepion pharaonis]|uniref:Translin-associated factor X-interacting protein 1 N-terminal domain-containing protein n=1 Tax=Acanthosepion pharaonis TaxID=158019 RepID=A0A812D6P4_ACAPH|nr:unnamed protein product [Sepia pharaonis]
MDQLKKKISSMKPLKQMAATTAERYEYKIMALREQDKQRLNELQLSHKELSEKLTSLLRSQHDAEYSMKRLMKEIENMQSKYQEQVNQRRFLVTKINDLRFQMEKLEEIKAQRHEDPQEDPVTIRTAIREAREREKISSQKINEMIANYSDLIPQPQYAELEEKYKEISENREKILNEFKSMQNKQSELLAVHSKLTEERNYYYVECEKLKRIEVATDHWNKCIDYINGGQTSWQEVSSGLSCQCLLEILQEMINENSGCITITNSIAIEHTVLPGLGLDPKVPAFLRYEGEVQSYRMFVRDCYLMVADIWAARMRETQAKSKPLIEFFNDYLKQLFPTAAERIKWAYTFNTACQKLAHNYDNINLFLEILNGNVDENIYYARQNLSSDLLLTLQAAEKRRQEEKNEDTVEPPDVGFLTQKEFSEELVQYFGITHQEDMLFLLKMALQQLQTKGNIEYTKLFLLDDEGEVGLFLTAVLDWQHEMQTEFINKLRHSGHSSSLSVSQFKKALHKVGSNLDTPCIDRLVGWVFESSAEDSNSTLPANDICDKLKSTFIPLFPKKAPKKPRA